MSVQKQVYFGKRARISALALRGETGGLVDWRCAAGAAAAGAVRSENKLMPHSFHL